MEQQLICPKCEGEMKVGHIWDTIRPGWYFPAFWIPGWGRIRKKDQLFPRLLHEDEGKPITAYRCEKCGYLELYAR